jgi:2-polyprenyl-6-methoxyphenol hydroxylase-like FAD-dependent oxidoreductase
MNQLPASIPIAIVGGGPVGMMLAMHLQRAGVECLIVNAEPGPRWHPKGSTQNARTMEHYRRLGIAAGIRAQGLPAEYPTDVGYFTRLTGWELSRIAMPSDREKQRITVEAGPTDQVPEPLLRCNQMYAEAYAFKHLQTLPGIAKRYGWRCIAFKETADGVSITIENVETGQQETFDSAYLVGCDGGQSMVRRQLGIRYGGETLGAQAYAAGPSVSTYLRAPGFFDRIPHARCWQYWTVNRDVRSNTVVLDGSDSLLFTTRLRNADDKPDEAIIARQFCASFGQNIDLEFIAHWPWTAGRALVADSFGRGRVLLAGDAVHLFTPTGGFGMNTGVDDAVNLAWKLAARVQGWGGPNLLASYEIERQPIAHRNTGAAKQFARNVGNVPVGAAMDEDSAAGISDREAARAFLADFGEEFASLGAQLGARYDGSPILAADDAAPPSDDLTNYRPMSRPGGRTPHLWLEDRSSLYDHLGTGFTLLRFKNAPDTRALETAAAKRGMPLKILNVALDAGRDLYERDLALIRPDHYVAWRGNRLPEDCDALIGRITGF